MHVYMHPSIVIINKAFFLCCFCFSPNFSLLQKLYYVQESHGIVVTDLAFLPDTPKIKPVKGNNEVAMLSVAVDSRCQLHTVANRSKYMLNTAPVHCKGAQIAEKI